MSVKVLLRKAVRIIRGKKSRVAELRSRGAVIGENCDLCGIIDHGHEFLVSMGNNVTMASSSRLLTHDGSTKKILGYSRVGQIDIGDDVFIGAAAIVMPGVKIGSRVIIGAGSIVTKDIPDNTVAVGNPARVIDTYDAYVEKVQKQFAALPRWDTHYSKKTNAEKQEMREALAKTRHGFDL